MNHLSLDRTSVKVHFDGTGVLKNSPQAIDKSRDGWTTKIHMAAADDRIAVTFLLSSGQFLILLKAANYFKTWKISGGKVIMGKAYEGDKARQLVFDLGMEPIIPLKMNRISPWEYNQKTCKSRMRLNIYCEG